MTAPRTAPVPRTTTAPRRVAVLVGSLRGGSYSRRIAHALAALAPPSLDLEIVEIGDLPFYDEDLDGAHPPEPWTRLRRQVREADAVLFVTPEYNRSLPAVLKNALDVASRPYGHSAWAGKPGAVVSTSVGALGGFGANHHLRQSLVFLDVYTMQQPEAYIGNTAKLFDPQDQGALPSDERAAGQLRGFIDAFAAWVERLVTAPAPAAEAAR